MKRDEAKQVVESGIEELQQALAAGRSGLLVRYSGNWNVPLKEGSLA